MRKASEPVKYKENKLSKLQAFLRILFIIVLGGLLFFILFNWFNPLSFASWLGYSMALYSLLVICIAIKKASERRGESEAKKGFSKSRTLLFRLLVFPPMILMILAAIYYNSSNGTIEVILGYLSALIESLGLLVIILFIFDSEKYGLDKFYK